MEKLHLPPCCYRVSVKAIIFDETRTKILLFKEDNGIWLFPGGGLEFGSTPQEDITREIKEEAGLQVTRVADQPSYFITSEKHDKTIRIAHVYYETKVKNLEFTPSWECRELGFFTKAEALKLKAYPLIPRILNQIDF